MSIETDWLKLDNLIKEGLGVMKRHPDWPEDAQRTMDQLEVILRKMDLVVNEKGPRYTPPRPMRFSPYR